MNPSREFCYYQPGQINLIDFAWKNGKPHLSKSPYQLKKRYPGAAFMKTEKAIDLIDQALEKNVITRPVEITEEAFFDALEILPPGNWQNYGNQGEHFHCIEFFTQNITSIYFRVGKKYFTCCDRTHKARQIFLILMFKEG